MKVEILLFASLRETVGRPTLAMEVSEQASVESLRAAILEREPRLRGIPFSIAVNRRLTETNDAIRLGDEIACIPPVSGG